MLKLFKKEDKNFWCVAYNDNIIHYGATVAKFKYYNDAVEYVKERESNNSSIEWFIFQKKLLTNKKLWCIINMNLKKEGI